MSFIGEGESNLILDLVLHRIDDETFFREYPMKPGEAGHSGLQMLQRALKERDSLGVSLGLSLGFRFGFSKDHLPTLHALTSEGWHVSHDNLIWALEKLKSPQSVDAFYYLALVSAHCKYPYLEHDEGIFSLGKNCTWSLRKLETREALLRLKDLLHCGNEIIEIQARYRLIDLEKKGKSEAIRDLAREIMQANPYTGSQELQD